MLETDIAPSTGQQPATIYLKDYRAPEFAIEKIDMDFQLGDKSTLLTAVLSVNKTSEHAQALRLNGEQLELVSIELNGQTLAPSSYEVDDEYLTIENVPQQFELRIQTRLYPHLNTALSGLYQSSGNFCTQCEAEGFRRITYFLDRPDVLTQYTVCLTADKQQYPVLLSNGNIMSAGENSDGTHWQKWHDPHPKPSYLFALVAGDLKNISDEFVTMNGRSVELNIYTQAHNIDQCQHAMTSLINSMRWDEQVYGREYDLDIYNIVAVDDFNMGAMENKGLNVFNSKFVLADQQTATDTDFIGVESVIGHEYFHNWSGNRVTCRDWFQLSLKEGFTVFRDQEFSADMASRGVKRIQDVKVLRSHQFKQDAGPMAHPIRPESYQEINNFYTVTIYEKGAEVIRMMHHLVGAAGFRKATDLYFDRFDGQAVTTEDFVQCMEQANDIDLTQFRLWYSQAGTPELSVTTEYDKNKQALCLDITQQCPATPGQDTKLAMQIPLQIALFDQQGNKLQSHSLSLTKVRQSFNFNALSAEPVVSFLRGFSAPVKVQFEQDNNDLAILAKYDDDGFARWEAMQGLYLNLILPAISTGQFDDVLYQQVREVYHVLLKSASDAQTDKAILAEMLQLPSNTYIEQQLESIDPIKVAFVRELLQERLAQDLSAEFAAVYSDNTKEQSDFSLNAQAVAQRALTNCVLSYVLLNECSDSQKLALHQYQHADNMTDRIAAFTLLVHSDYPEREALIDDFYQQWQDNSLVMDKWFTIQAIRPRKETMSDVVKLMSHPAFELTNPNKVRALLGAFASNSVAFHQAQGYSLLADSILQLNKINPQIAARLMSCFNDWRAYSEPFSQLMKQQIERINEDPQLSKDVKEIASKALA